jgi:peptidoglycan/LPS O-acetylase OafA/YrhL
LAVPKMKVQPLGYRRSLDGLRACAIAIVLFHHALIPGFLGGEVGVDLFFALSGFLITALLLEERTGGGRIDLPRFWARRGLRLLPALAVCIVVTLVVTRVGTPAAVFDRNRSAVVPVLFYYANWFRAFHGAGSLGTLDHTWSLGIEEQFYLIWPLILVVAGWRGARPQLLIGICLAGAAASLLARILLEPSVSIDRIVSGTDTHCDGLLLGCALAVAMTLPGAERLVRRAAATLLIPAVLAIAALVALPTWLAWSDRYYSFMYTWGLTLAAVASVVIVANLVLFPQRRAARLLATAPPVLIGEISYGIYLWHATVFHSVQYVLPRVPDALVWTAEIAATLVVASLSWKFLEAPLQRVRRRLSARRPAAAVAAP